MRPEHRPDLLIKDLGGLFLYYPGQSLLNRFPRSALRQSATLGARLVGLLGTADHRAELNAICVRSLRPRSTLERYRIIADALQLTLYNELEVLRYPFLNPQTIAQVCEVQGREHLDRALQRGRGAILLIGHYGANQMIMPALGHAGYPVSQLSAPPPVWAEILRESRTTPLWEKVLARRWELEKKLPVRHINVFRFLRPAFDCLRDNGALCLAFDGGGGKKWAKVDFLGRKANVSVEPMRIWQKTKAALLPAFVDRAPGAERHTVRILPEMEMTGSAEEGLQSYVRLFEREVWEHPEQYLHFLAMRRRVRGTDVQPFFDDYPPAERQMSQEEAAERLRRAGEWVDPG